MSHTLFQHSMLCNALVWAWLHDVDEAEAARCREAGCRHCPGKLHSATYPRKPYGLAARVEGRGHAAVQLLLRGLPPASDSSVGAVLWAPLLSGRPVRSGERAGAERRGALADDQAEVGDLGRHAAPLAEVVAGGVPGDGAVGGKAGRAGDAARGGAAALSPWRQMQGGRFGQRLLLSLIWFRPWTGYCGLGDGPVPPAES